MDNKSTHILTCTYCKSNSNYGFNFSCEHFLCHRCIYLPLLYIFSSNSGNFQRHFHEKEFKIQCIICFSSSFTVSSYDLLSLINDENIKQEKNSDFYKNNYDIDEEFPISKNNCDLICEGCEIIKGTSFCLDCQTLFCEECLGSLHNKIKKNKNHEIQLDLNYLNRLNYCCCIYTKSNRSLKSNFNMSFNMQFLNNKENLEENSLHNKAEYYCEDCRVELCKICINTHSHSDHISKIQLIKDLYSKFIKNKSLFEERIGLNGNKQITNFVLETLQEERNYLKGTEKEIVNKEIVDLMSNVNRLGLIIKKLEDRKYNEFDQNGEIFLKAINFYVDEGRRFDSYFKLDFTRLNIFNEAISNKTNPFHKDFERDYEGNAVFEDILKDIQRINKSIEDILYKYNDYSEVDIQKSNDNIDIIQSDVQNRKQESQDYIINITPISNFSSPNLKPDEKIIESNNLELEIEKRIEDDDIDKNNSTKGELDKMIDLFIGDSTQEIVYHDKIKSEAKENDIISSNLNRVCMNHDKILLSNIQIQDQMEIKSNLFSIYQFPIEISNLCILTLPIKQNNLKLYSLFPESNEVLEIKTNHSSRITKILSAKGNSSLSFKIYTSSSDGIVKIFSIYTENTSISTTSTTPTTSQYSYNLDININIDVPISTIQISNLVGIEKKEILIIALSQVNLPLVIFNLENNQKLKSIPLLKNSISYIIEVYTNQTLNLNYAFVGENKSLSIYELDYARLHKNFKTVDKVTCIKTLEISDKSYLAYSDENGGLSIRMFMNWMKCFYIKLDTSINDFIYYSKNTFGCLENSNFTYVKFEKDELDVIGKDDIEKFSNKADLNSFLNLYLTEQEGRKVIIYYLIEKTGNLLVMCKDIKETILDL